MRILSETKKMNGTGRKEKRRAMRKQWRAGRDSTSFRRFLVKIGKEEDDTCRLCGSQAETAQHLLFECDQRRKEFSRDDGYSTEEFESASVKLMKAMRNFE